MDKRIVQNALNFFLSDRFSFKGTDTLPLVEIIRELQAQLGDGRETDTQDGAPSEPLR